MSVDAALVLRIVENTWEQAAITPIATLQMLINNGWRVQRDGSVYYLPLGDSEDDANWTEEIMSIDSLIKILQEKERQDELIGVHMTWQDTDIGGPLFLRNDKTALQKGIFTPMSFGLSSDRKILKDYGNFKITDVNWYLERLLPIFNQGETRVEYFEYSEHI